MGVAFARSYDKESLKNTNLYVTSIPSSHSSEEALRQLFGQYGKIINVKVRYVVTFNRSTYIMIWQVLLVSVVTKSSKKVVEKLRK